MLSLHKTFDIGKDGKRQLTLYLYDGEQVTKLSNEELFELLTTFKPGTVVRMTAVNALDSIVKALEATGCVVMYAHWHNTGIDKGLSPEEIVKAYHNSAAEFRQFTYNPKLDELRNHLSLRTAVMQMYGDSLRRVAQIGRNIGVVTSEDLKTNELLGPTVNNLDQLYKCFMGEGKNGKAVAIDTVVNNLAAALPECQLFNKIAGLKGGFITAASIVSLTGDIHRFPTVASYWHYFGQHVNDGKAPKRAKGIPCTWSPEGRTVLYNLGESLIKNRANPWRDYFDEAKTKYAEEHKEKCGCAWEKGHTNAQARRKTVKEIMKRFYIAASGLEFQSDHSVLVNHLIDVAKGASV